MKHYNLMKKLTAAAVSVSMALSLAACSNGGGQSGSASSGSSAPSGDGYKIAVVKQLDHASLDEIANAITARLDAIAEENNITIDCQVYSGQDGSQDLLNQIGTQVIADGVDAIIPIATTAAQLMAVAAEQSKTPVIFSAISDPETAEMTGIDYVTGISDALNTQFILDMMLAQNPDLKSVGLLYSLSEPNSTKPIAEAKAYLDSKGIKYVEATGNTTDEVISAVSTLKGQVDAVFTPTDNVVMKAELHRRGLLRPERRLCHLRRELHRPGHQDRRPGLPGTDRRHGRPGRLLSDGWRHHHRQHRDRRCPGH